MAHGIEALGKCIPAPRQVLPVSWCGYGYGYRSDPDRQKLNHLFIGPLPTFPELLTDRQTKRQTNNDDHISSLAEVMKRNFIITVRSYTVPVSLGLHL